MSAGAISEFLDLMSDTVTFYAVTGRNSQGAATHSNTASSPIPCRIEMKNHLVIDGRPKTSGREILARGRVILGSSFMPGVEDIIVLPNEYVPTRPPMIAVNKVPDELGGHHVVIEIG